MSYSSLREIEECPRRWALRRAHYPQIWDRSGYPDLPSLTSLFGDVVHATLERVLREIVDYGCDSLDSPCAVAALQKCGGYSSLIDTILESRLIELARNPRLGDRLSSMRNALRLRRPELRQRVQLILSRSKFFLKAPADVHAAREARDYTPFGSSAEVELRPDRLAWTGRADLITVTPNSCTIVDYKTGAPHDAHAEQLRIYALLWSLDRSHNPSARLATELVVAYSTHDQSVQPPSQVELGDVESKLRARTDAALLELRKRPPEARPAPEVCDHCSVRQLCGEYWRFLRTRDIESSHAGTANFGDVELRVVAQHGPKSWRAVLLSDETGSSGSVVRLQSGSDALTFSPDTQLRLLNVAIERDDETQNLVLTMTQNGEAFRVNSVARAQLAGLPPA